MYKHSIRIDSLGNVTFTTQPTDETEQRQNQHIKFNEHQLVVIDYITTRAFDMNIVWQAFSAIHREAEKYIVTSHPQDSLSDEFINLIFAHVQRAAMSVHPFSTDDYSLSKELISLAKLIISQDGETDGYKTVTRNLS